MRQSNAALVSHASPSSPAWLQLVIGVCFFLSGAAALTYQVSWLKALGLLFGHTTYAITAVLAAFMAGLALGSWWLGRLAERVDDPFRLYGFLECGIGLSGVASLGGLWLVQQFYVPVHNVFADQPILLLTYRFLASFIVLLIPTTLMGGTYPVVLKFLTHHARDLGAYASRLYWVNTAGAITGAALAGFVLLWHAGLRNSLLFACALNLIVATTVLLSRRRLTKPALAEEGAGEADEGSATPPVGAWLAMLVAGATGFTSMMFEISWTRILSVFLGSTTYAFTLMLMTFLLGITLGSYVFERWHRRFVLTFALLGRLITLLALGGLLFIALSAELGELTLLLARMVEQSIGLLFLAQFIIAFLGMIVPTVLFGVTFPLTMVLYCGQDTRRGARSGALYAVNTVGAIAGAMVTGLFLISMLDRVNTALAGSGLLAVLALLIFLTERRREPTHVIVGAAVLVLIAVLTASQAFSRPILYTRTVLANINRLLFRTNLTLAEISAMDDLVFAREGLNASVVVARREGTVSLRTDGKTEASSLDQQTQLFQSYLPLSLHPAPRRVLIIGFGSGATVQAAAQFSTVEQVDCVEIEPVVVEAAPYLEPLNHGILQSPKVRIIVDDARSYLATTEAKYDVIISEPSYLWSAGVASLFTSDFYRQVTGHLAAGGLFLQWVPNYQLLPDDLGVVVRTLQDSFKEVSLWRGSDSDFLFLVSPTARTYSLATLDEEFARNEGLRASLSRYMKVDEPEGILAYYLLDSAAISGLATRNETNTDDRTVLEFRAALNLARDTSSLNEGLVAGLRRHSLPPFVAVKDPAGALLAAAETQIRLGMLTEPLGAPAVLTVARFGQPSERRSFILAALNLAQGRTLPALEIMRGAEKSNPQSARVLYNLGQLYANQGMFDLARSYLERSLTADQELRPYLQQDTLRALIDLERRTGRYENAVAWQRRLLDASPSEPFLEWAKLGELYLLAKQTDSAIPAFETALKLEPMTYLARRHVADLFVKDGQLDRARAEFLFLEQYYPLEDPNIYLQLADLQQRLGKRALARRALTKARRLFPLSPDVWQARLTGE